MKPPVLKDQPWPRLQTPAPRGTFGPFRNKLSLIHKNSRGLRQTHGIPKNPWSRHDWQLPPPRLLAIVSPPETCWLGSLSSLAPAEGRVSNRHLGWGSRLEGRAKPAANAQPPPCPGLGWALGQRPCIFRERGKVQAGRERRTPVPTTHAPDGVRCSNTCSAQNVDSNLTHCKLVKTPPCKDCG